MTLALPAPFGGHEAGSIDTSAVVCKVSELAGLMALVALAVQGGQLMTGSKLPALRLMSEALVVSLIVGAGLFGMGKAAEPWLPQWQPGIEPIPIEADHKAEHDEHAHDAAEN